MEALLYDYDVLCIYEAMEDYTSFDSVEIAMFESGFNTDKKKEKLWNKNQSLMVNGVNLVIRMIKKCKEIIINILKGIKNTVDYIFLSKEDKAKFAEYEAYLRTHKEYKGRKITVKDWKKVEAKYNGVYRRIDQLEQRVNTSQIAQEEMKKEEASILDDLVNLAGTCTSTVTADVALRTAKSCPEHARKIQQMLQKNTMLLDQMEEDLGKKEVAKFQKKINKYTKDTFFTRLRAQVYGREQRSLVECMSDVIKQVGDIDTSGKGKLSMVSKNLGWAKNNKGILSGFAKHGLIDKDNRERVQRVAGAASDLKKSADDVGLTGMINSFKSK
nr:MAG TPA: hypothetical protein [Caudoviricetes sp.]